MVRLDGSEAREVARAGTAALVNGAPVRAAEVDWAVGVEGASTVEDTLYRRLRTALYNPDARETSVMPIAERMAALLGWSEERKRAEASQALERLAADLAFRA